MINHDEIYFNKKKGLSIYWFHNASALKDSADILWSSMNGRNWGDVKFPVYMGTLLYKHIENEDNKLIKHSLNLLIISKRPKGWEKHIESYIVSENKNSYYLYDIYMTLRAEYKYSFASDATINTLKKFIKMAIAKHDLGMKKPNLSILKKVSDSILPKRDNS